MVMEMPVDVRNLLHATQEKGSCSRSFIKKIVDIESNERGSEEYLDGYRLEVLQKFIVRAYER